MNNSCDKFMNIIVMFTFSHTIKIGILKDYTAYVHNDKKVQFIKGNYKYSSPSLCQHGLPGPVYRPSLHILWKGKQRVEKYQQMKTILNMKTVKIKFEKQTTENLLTIF